MPPHGTCSISGIYPDTDPRPHHNGTGMCGGCRVTVGGEIKFACVDGPDFDGHQVDYDELMKRNSTYREFEAHDRENCRMYKAADEMGGAK